MSQIGTSLSLQDLVTGPARNIVGAMNHVIDCFETLNDVSGASVDISALQDARAEMAQLEATINSVEASLGDAGDQQNRLNQNIQAGVGAAESFGSKIKGIAAAIGGAAVVRFSVGFVTESLDLADTQRNAENQLKLVLANMGVQDVEVPVTANTGAATEALNTYSAQLDSVDGKTVTVALTTTTDTTQTTSAFDAITAKAADIQSKGIYGDEAMIAGAAEFATYFSDGDAILSMMDTLADYAMGMSGGGEVDNKAMVDYATGLGKIMSGSYEAMTKKGFEFTDAQKAIIEGTATQAQIVETLGAEYLDASADMQAAAAINSVIAEAWDGLYESMSNTPEGKIIQFTNKMGDLRESIGNQLYPYVLRLFETFEQHFPQIQSLATGFANGLGVIITILANIIGFIADVGAAVVDNWSWIEPIIWGIVAALGAYYAAMLITNTITAVSATAKAVHAAALAMESGATFAATAAQYGFNAALYACPITWIVVAIIALIAVIIAVIRAMDLWGAQSHSIIGDICGTVMVGAAFIGNILIAAVNLVIDCFVLIYNLVAEVANFIGNVFTDPIGAICRLFFGLADTVLGILEALASAIDCIFGSDLAGSVRGWRDGLGGWVDDTFGKGEEVMEKLDPNDLHLGRFEYSAAFEMGANFGDGLSDSISGIFDTSPDDVMNQFNMDTSGIAGNTADIAESVGGMSDSLECSEEDLKYLRDIAEQEAINRFTTAEIVIEQHNENHIASDMDVDGIMDKWTEQFTERLDISEEGVHE